MRLINRPWLAALPLAFGLAFTLAGCSGGGIVPGLGGSGGLGTPGTGTNDPDATLYFRLRGTNVGDFKAGEVVTTSSVLGFQIQGSVPTGSHTTPTTRVATIRFNGLPVQGANYAVGAEGDNGAVLQYAERNDATRAIRLWSGVSGNVHVSRVTADHVVGSFTGTLNGVQNVTGQITASGGLFSVKYQH